MPLMIATTIKPDKHLWLKKSPDGDLSWVAKRENATAFDKRGANAAKAKLNDGAKIYTF